VTAAVIVVRYAYRCRHPGCTNAVSVWPFCPMHGGVTYFETVTESAPVYAWSACLAAARGEFLRERAAA